MRAKHAGNTLTERYLRETYDQWRRSIIKDELRVTQRRAAVYGMLKDQHRLISGLAMILLVLALMFPPFQLSAGGQSIHLGFGLVFERHVGRIDAPFLLCEVLSVMALYWLARQFIRVESPQEQSAGDP